MIKNKRFVIAIVLMMAMAISIDVYASGGTSSGGGGGPVVFNTNSDAVPALETADFIWDGTAGTAVTAATLGVDVSGDTVYMTNLDVDNLVVSVIASSSAFYAQNGADATPSYTFANDTDTGFYLSGANEIGVGVAGSLIWKMTATRLGATNSNEPVLLNQAGTATVPAYSYIGDLNTGLGHAAADQLTLIASGTNLLNIIGSQAGVSGRVQLPNNTYLSALDNAGTSFVNMFKLNTSDQIQLAGELTGVNSWYLGEDTGLTTRNYMNVSASSSDGTEMGWVDKIDGNNIVKVSALSDGAGGVDTLQIVLDPAGTFGSAVFPTLAFGDGDSGVYESSEDSISITLGGARRWALNGDNFSSNNANGPAIKNVDSTATIPNITSDKADADTGIGSAAADQLSLIAGADEIFRASSTAATSSAAFPGTNSKGSCLVLTDEDDGASLTYITVRDGVITASATSCLD